MRDLPRFFLSPDQLSGPEVTLREQDAAHISKVLRLKPGREILVLDGRGALCFVALTDVARDAVTGTIIRREQAGGEPPIPITLVQALPKGDRFEWIIQKATELGVARIVPVLTERTVVQLKGDRMADRLRRWLLIAKEAAEQCERGRIPEIAAPEELETWLSRGSTAGTERFACLERTGATTLFAQRETLLRSEGIELIIGPEGGFADAESRALAASCSAMTLGPRILRTETAGLAALAIAVGLTEQASIPG